jgi:hypothetical protein
MELLENAVFITRVCPGSNTWQLGTKNSRDAVWEETLELFQNTIFIKRGIFQEYTAELAELIVLSRTIITRVPRCPGLKLMLELKKQFVSPELKSYWFQQHLISVSRCIQTVQTWLWFFRKFISTSSALQACCDFIFIKWQFLSDFVSFRIVTSWLVLFSRYY